jgi:CRISPR/Cas system CSM-associated protein Csm3 (group 7 of RAMP superfamily)
MNYFQLHVCIDMEEGWHVGGGKGFSGNIGYHLKDFRRSPYVPGSQWKGVLRDIMGQCYGGSGCQGGTNCNCLMCRLFGTVGNRRGTIRFSDLKIPENENRDEKAHTFIRAGIRLDPYRNVAADGALFLTETAAEVRLEGDIDGYLANGEVDFRALLTGLRLLEALGGGKGRGMGAIKGIEVKLLKGFEWKAEWGGQEWRYD